MDIFDIPPHPAADAFPMMEEEELWELAQDITTNGLQQPLVVHELDGEPLLIDGRNRREACRRAGVIPDYVLLDGQDPVTYILSANINRRHMTKGQRAMAVARICFETKQSVRDGAKQSGTSVGRLAYATAVINHAPDLADQVINGSLSLDKAYEEAKIRKGQAESYEAVFNRVKAKHPDLAEMIVEGKLTLKEAVAVEMERAEKERQRKEIMAVVLHKLAAGSYVLTPEWRGEVVQFVIQESALYERLNMGSVDEFIEAVEVFSQYANVLLEEIKNAQKS